MIQFDDGMREPTKYRLTVAEAKELLNYHSGAHPDIEDYRWEFGFLGNFRPFGGILYERNFHEIIACLYALHPKLCQARIDAEIVSSLWSICTYGRQWALSKDGMLRRNGLIDSKDRRALDKWISAIEWTTAFCLERTDRSTAFIDYSQEYPDHFQRMASDKKTK